MLNAVGKFFTTPAGVWTGLGLTAAFDALALWNEGLSTNALSVLALVLSLFILARQGVKDGEDEVRDKAMHLKLDELIHGVPEADDTVAEIERKLQPKED